jgi:trans-aconitate 2-methyltransferase
VGGYAFGDSAPAARRLGLLADVFEPPSRAFLAEFTRVAGDQVDLAVDLGCGPGHSTRLVASVVGARRTLGLDRRGRSWPWPPPGHRPGASSPSTT